MQKKSKTPVAKIWQNKEKKILPKKVEAPVSKWASNDPESTQSLYSSPLSKLSVSSNSFQYQKTQFRNTFYHSTRIQFLLPNLFVHTLFGILNTELMQDAEFRTR